jgi:hypothetical protein
VSWIFGQRKKIILFQQATMQQHTRNKEVIALDAQIAIISTTQWYTIEGQNTNAVLLKTLMVSFITC